MKFKSIVIILSLFFLIKNLSTQAQPLIKKTYPSSFDVSFYQDSYFGFYLNASGSMGIDKKLDFTYYTNFWTNPAFGEVQTGTDFWAEAGVGLSYKFLNDKLTLNPSLGLTFGKVLSGGNSTVIGDGIVPSLFVCYQKDDFNLESNLVYYKALRKEGPVTIDYLLFWAWAGFDVNKNIALGLHYEDFMKTREDNAKSENLYRWLGPYLQFIIEDKYQFRLTLGAELLDETEADEFYKFSVILPLK